LGVTLAHASGKAILFGEHAVVYGRPAIAVPVDQVRAEAESEEGPRGQGIVIIAEDLGKVHTIGQTSADGAMWAVGSMLVAMFSSTHEAL